MNKLMFTEALPCGRSPLCLLFLLLLEERLRRRPTHATGENGKRLLYMYGMVIWIEAIFGLGEKLGISRLASRAAGRRLRVQVQARRGRGGQASRALRVYANRSRGERSTMRKTHCTGTGTCWEAPGTGAVPELYAKSKWRRLRVGPCVC